MSNILRKTMLLLQYKLKNKDCSCYKQLSPPCQSCIEVWMSKNHHDLIERYKKLPEPLRQQTINRQMALFRQYTEE